MFNKCYICHSDLCGSFLPGENSSPNNSALETSEVVKVIENGIKNIYILLFLLYNVPIINDDDKML